MIDVDNSVIDVVNYNLFNLGGYMGANQFTENSISHLDLPCSSGVYMITDKALGHRYIGSSVNIKRRAMQHFSELKTTRGKHLSLYERFKSTYNVLGPVGFDVTVLVLCAEKDLLMYEEQCISILGDTINHYNNKNGVVTYSDIELKSRSERTKTLWANPEYRERAIAARKGKAYNKGYKCTPEQVENRKKAGRISNMKRAYGDDWKTEYIRRYPTYVEDLNGY